MKNDPKRGSQLTSAAKIIVLGLFLIPAGPLNAQISTVNGREISVQNVKTIIVDHANTKWFGTDLGILSFDGKIWTLHDHVESLPKQGLKNLIYLAGAEGPELWIASPKGASVTRIPVDEQTEVFTYTPENAPMISQEVLGIAAGKDSIHWIGTDRGVSALSNDKWLTPDYDLYYNERMFMNYPITSMATNPKGDSLYVGTSGIGVVRVYRDDLDGISGASVYAQWGPIILPSDNILCIYISPDGTKWFGTEEGVARHTGSNTLDNWTAYTEDDGLIHNYVQAICGDRNGKIWFGTQAGISVFDGSSWVSYTREGGLVSNNILSITSDLTGSVWIGTDAGISCFVNQKFINY
jgi:ligand-binding sensor domain-containing protein